MRRRPLNRTLTGIILSVALIVYATGCVSVPEEVPGEMYIGMMPEEAALFMKLDVAENKELANLILTPIQKTKLRKTTDGEVLNKQLIERTDSLYGGFAGMSEESPGFSIVALGRYPSGIIKSNLNRSADLKRKVNPYEVWIAEELGFELAVPAPYVICLSTMDVEDMVEGFREKRRHHLPAEVRREFDISDLVVYMPSPGKELFKQAGPGPSLGSLPIQGMWITLFSTKHGYETSVVFDVSEEKTKQVAMLSRLFLVAVLRAAGADVLSQLKESVDVSTARGSVRIAGLLLSVDDIAKILEHDMFNNREK